MEAKGFSLPLTDEIEGVVWKNFNLDHVTPYQVDVCIVGYTPHYVRRFRKDKKVLS